MRGRALRFGLTAAALAAVLAMTAAGLATAQGTPPNKGPAKAAPAAGCQLGGSIKHVIYLQFDNTHFRRDNPNVPSDLEQMPNLLDFLTQNGTLFTNDHTILISHTAGGILASLTGLYPDRNGQTVSNSYDYYRNNGLPTFTSSFKYWTNTVDGADDPLPNMVTDGQQTTPAPWLTYTHAGCDVGGVSAANIELENNTITPGGDIATVFGNPSPEASEPAALRTTDFVGIAIHCTLGSQFCAGNAHAKPDQATTVPGSDEGYQALFGAKYVNPAINDGNGCVEATDGSNITDAAGNCGFPGFDGAFASNTLGEVERMQEAGVPVTFAYISDAHDCHVADPVADTYRSSAQGPGEACYRQQLASYNTAFGTFFQDLAANGIDRSNTLFVVTVDEGDHFAGSQVQPDASGNVTYSHTTCPQASLTSVTPCPSNQLGEVNARIGGLLPAGEPGFDIHFDDAPTFYVNGDAAHPNGPARTDPAVRKLERDVAAATAPDPYANAVVPIAQRLADTVEEKTLHMINSDPKRTPTFTMFGDPDFFFQTSNVCGPAGTVVCVNPGFAWNHGDVQQEIGNTWVGFVGPGVTAKGVDSETWTDHVNVRPTINALVGLHDSYGDDGRVLIEALTTKATPQTLIAHRETVRRLGAVYEQLNAPFGSFATQTLEASTAALASTDDATYNSIENAIASLTSQRDALAAQIKAALNGAAFSGQALNEQQAKGWIDQADALIAQASELAASS
jgi:hypothetical protein